MQDLSKATIGAAATIVIFASALVSSLIYVAFYAVHFTTFQKTVVVLVSLIVAVAAVSIVWIVWAGRRGLIRGWTN